MHANALDSLPEMVDRRVRDFDPERIDLLGSYAWGEPNKDSDIDLMIVVPDLAARPSQAAARGHRCLRGIGIPKDLLIRTHAQVEKGDRAPGSLEHLILDRGILLYERGIAGSHPQVVSHLGS